MSHPPQSATNVAWTPTRTALVLGTLWGLAAMGTSAASVVLGDLRDEMDVPVSSVAWVLTAFALTFAASTPVFGRLADTFGPRRPYVLGVGLLSLGALVAALAPSIGVLLLGRAIQGVGAGSIPVLSNAIISARFEGSARAVALGRANSAVVVLASLGPIIGGVLGTAGSWRLPLALPVLALVLLPFTYRLAPASGSRAPVDLVGAALVSASAASLIVLVQTATSLSLLTAAAAATTPVLFLLLVRRVRRVPDGFLPAELVANPTLVRSSVAAASMPVVYFASLIAVPLFLAARGWSPLANGLLLLPGALVGSTVSFNSSRAVARWGRVGTARRGLVVSLAGSLAVSAMGVNPLFAGLGFVAIASGYSLAQPALVGEVAVAVPERLRGGALGLFNLVFFIGAGFGAAVIGGLGETIPLGWAMLVTAVAPIGALLTLQGLGQGRS